MKSHPFLEIWSAQREGVRNSGESNKIVVRDQLGCSKCREGIEQELPTAFELSDGEQVKATINLQSVATVPVTARLNQSGRETWVSLKRQALLCVGATHSSALVKLAVIIPWSEKKNPMRARVRTMSILAPRPGVFSKASFCASTARSLKQTGPHISDFSLRGDRGSVRWTTDAPCPQSWLGT